MPKPDCKHDQGVQQKMGGVICNRCRLILFTGTLDRYLVEQAKKEKQYGLQAQAKPKE